MARHTTTGLRLAAAAWLVTAAACDDGESSQGLYRGGGSTAAATPEAAGSAPPSAPTLDPEIANATNIPEKLKTVDWNQKDDLERDLRDTRDPFQVYVDDLKPRTPGQGEEKPGGYQCSGPCDEASSLDLIAIITGTSVHKAMLKDSKGVGHMVRAGDVVGKDPYRITRITRNEVVLKPLQPVQPGSAPPPELVKRLVSQEELQELLP